MTVWVDFDKFYNPIIVYVHIPLLYNFKIDEVLSVDFRNRWSIWSKSP